MSYSISASKAKATHDMAMSIIETEARERALRTQRLREQRLAREAQVEVLNRSVLANAKSRSPKKKSLASR